MRQNRVIKSRNGSASSSNAAHSQDRNNQNDSVMTETNENDINDFNQNDKKLNSQNQNNYTAQLQRERKMNSQNQILKAFNSIRDMNNKEQINQAILMITQVKDRVLLIEKLLERREQITKAKEMQQINNLAPLFNKIKAKFLNSLEKNKFEKGSNRNSKSKSTYVQQSKDINSNEGQQQTQGTIQQQIDSSGNTLKTVLTNRSSARKKTGLGSIIPHSPKNQNPEQEEDSNSVQQQNKNIMGAITIFATHDIKMDKDKEEIERKRHNTLLGYLQKDNNLRTEDRLKSPVKQPKLKQNGNQSAGNIAMSNSNNNPHSSNNQNSNALPLTNGNIKQQQSDRPKSLSLASPSSAVSPGTDYNQKMLALKKKMFQVGSVGRRDSPQNNTSKLLRIRSMNGSPSQFQKLQDMDHIKGDTTNKYYFQPKLNNFTSASQGLHSQSSGNFNNTITNSQQQPLHRRSSTNKQSTEGVLFDFIMECEQKRLINKHPSFNNDPQIQKKMQLKSQGSPKILVPFKTSIVPCKNLQIKNNENHSILNKIYFMRKQYSNNQSYLTNQMTQSKLSKNTFQYFGFDQTNHKINQ